MRKEQKRQVRMSLEAAAPILHAGGSGYWSSDADPETTASPGSTLNDQAALFRDALLVPLGKGSRKYDLSQSSSLISPQLANRGQGHLFTR